MRTSILHAESKRLMDASYRPVKITKPKSSIPEPREKRKLEFDDSVSRMQADYKQRKAQLKQRPQVNFKPTEIVDGKREVTKEILSARGLVRKRDKHQGNARVHNRMKFTKKQKQHDAMTRKNRVEEADYTGEGTGINMHIKRSLKL
ncbi:bifunctional Sas10-Utp3-C1D/Sas10 C-terminal domain [Babesia duncani]|uniref:Bifunctional Sas10-Utp3-C1D/Sas10 C-terminal domain n=1 Tax=Babesia duncani TaxID=323732 RepID=A0AAD9PJ46_9APIC|nr:bifunctional Sas10-Utp3-C1D/Sas10 C-terminal domain [Babesia duncani]